MGTLTPNLSRWTTEDLLVEVLRRSATDGPALQLLETVIIRARLAECDRQFGELEVVRGTTEMGVAEVRPTTAVLAGSDHEVDVETPGAHAHDHTHRRITSAKFAAHEHPHRHLANADSDAELNGHSHASTHSRFPWEDADPA
jgi:hypothetical protein